MTKVEQAVEASAANKKLSKGPPDGIPCVITTMELLEDLNL